MRLPSRQIVALNERGRAFIAASNRLNYVAVCLVGYEGRVPRHFGDNEGCWPVRVATSSKPKEISKRMDLESPIHKVTVHDFVWTASDAHAKRLKAALDKLLLGASQESRALRHGWRDAEAEPAVLWPILLEDALNGLRQEGAFSVFGEEERLVKAAKAAGVKIKR